MQTDNTSLAQIAHALLWGLNFAALACPTFFQVAALILTALLIFPIVHRSMHNRRLDRRNRRTDWSDETD